MSKWNFNPVMIRIYGRIFFIQLFAAEFAARWTRTGACDYGF